MQTTVQITTTDGTADAYLASQPATAPSPAYWFMDAFGLRPRIAEMAARIAGRGYAVLVPNLLYRGGRPPLVTPDELGDPDKRGAAYDRISPMLRELTTGRIAAGTTARRWPASTAGGSPPTSRTARTWRSAPSPARSVSDTPTTTRR